MNNFYYFTEEGLINHIKINVIGKHNYDILNLIQLFTKDLAETKLTISQAVRIFDQINLIDQPCTSCNLPYSFLERENKRTNSIKYYCIYCIILRTTLGLKLRFSLSNSSDGKPFLTDSDDIYLNILIETSSYNGYLIKNFYNILKETNTNPLAINEKIKITNSKIQEKSLDDYL